MSPAAGVAHPPMTASVDPAGPFTEVAAAPPRPGLGLEVALGAAALVGAVAVGRLVRGGWTGPAAWPLLATTLVGLVVVAAIEHRRRVATAVATSLGVAAVGLVAVATAVAGATWFGLPEARTPRRVDDALHAVRAATTGWHWPLAARPGVVLVAALASGLGAVAARSLLAFPSRPAGPRAQADAWPGAALGPALVLVAVSGLARPGAGAAALAAAFLVAAGAVVVTAEPEVATGGDHGAGGRARRVGAVGVALVIVVAVVGATVGGRSPGPGSGPGSGPAVSPTGLALATDLVGLEQRDAKVVMFRAQSPADTYWQVGQVTVWDGDGFAPDPATVAVLSSSATPPGQPPGSTPRGTTQARVTMAALSTRLLPALPRTVSVDPASTATVTDVGVVAPSPARPGQRYGVTAAVSPSGDDLAGAAAAAPGLGLDPADQAGLVAVPVDRAPLVALAAQATAGATTPLARAQALVNWFHSGRFHYQLDAPPTPTGTDAVLGFLESTRTGNCQTFATAFTLLARAMGLPTRVAIGFTGGTRAPDGSTVVRGADAHAWPQVHLGAAGWVSFEPTPQLPGNELAPPDVVSRTPLTAPTTVAPATTTPPTTQPRRGGSPSPGATAGSPSSSTAPTTTATATSTTGVTVGGAPIGRRPASGRGTGRAAGLVGLAVVVLGALAVVGVRRRRRHRLGPDRALDPVAAAYLDAVTPLAGVGWRRRPGQSPVAHARQVLEAAVDTERAAPTEPAAAWREAAVDLLALATATEQAVYRRSGPDRPRAEIERWARTVRATLGRRDVQRLLADSAPPAPGTPAQPPTASPAEPARELALSGPRRRAIDRPGPPPGAG